MRRRYQAGQKVGGLTILNYISSGKYKCQCECDNIVDVDVSNIRRNQHCRQCMINDITGRRFGRLVAKKRTYKTRGGKKRTAWECDCDCGGEITVYYDSLMDGYTESCGCITAGKDMPEKIKKEFVSGTQLSKIQSKPTKANKSGVVGVNWDKSRNKWQASIRFRGKKYHLGRFDKDRFDDAVAARREGEKKYFGRLLDQDDELKQG